MFKIGLLKETRIPIDRRVALTPQQGLSLLTEYKNLELYVHPSDIRCYTDEEYLDFGHALKKDLSNCNLLLGVKEVNVTSLMPGKTYMFFSHVAKKQAHNRQLLQQIIKKKITLIDYEFITDDTGRRLVAFGHWAGIVGAYNGLIAFGKRLGTFDLKPAHKCFDVEELFSELKKVKLPPIKILITGTGRVAKGALALLKPLKLKQVSPNEYLLKNFNEPVFCVIDAENYVKRKDNKPFDFQHFVSNPKQYVSTFKPYTKVTDLYLACHFWNPLSPKFITREDMIEQDFKISVIADISCDINGPIASTVRASSIAEPFYGYDPHNDQEGIPFGRNNITVMAVDNLPGELPRDASRDFGKDLQNYVFPELLSNNNSKMIERATIVKNGKLTERFEYLQNWVDEKE